MALSSGTRLGPYEILAPIGAGGMGEVYRARDTKLDRDVAIKVLPEEFAEDAERLARFEREAKLLASLNHPNIASIHGFEESDGVGALVLELVEGPTLAEYMEQGASMSAVGPHPHGGRSGDSAPARRLRALPVDEVLAIARQIAEALEAGHEAGVIHRDLKPANIKLKEDGTVKVLDYGLAKALAGEPGTGSSADLSQSPTRLRQGSGGQALTREGTRVGVILGTAAYMSPEQAKGKGVDKRTDIFSFGVVLYEMLSGKRAFDGDSAGDVLAAVIKLEPDWDALPSVLSPSIQKLLRRCLEKEPRRRLRDIGDARLEIHDALTEAPAVEHEAQSGRARTLVMTAAVTALLTASLVWWVAGAEPTAAVDVTHAAIPYPPDAALLRTFTPSLAVSPDGRRVAYRVRREGRSQIYLRSLDDRDGRPIAGTEDALMPFFSPDGEWLGFQGNTDLLKISVDGGAPIRIAEVGNTELRGATWSTDGTIYFSGGQGAGISRVSEEGGPIESLTVPNRDEGEKSHRFPKVLPDGHGLLFTIGSGAIESFDDASIGWLSLETGDYRILVEGGTNPHYSPTGHLVYGRRDELVAVPFDLDTKNVTGRPVSLLSGVASSPIAGSVEFDLAANGNLVYASGDVSRKRRIVWVDRDGNKEAAVRDIDDFYSATVSPDGRRLAAFVGRANNNIWVYELDRGTVIHRIQRFDCHFPTFSPDGDRLAFSSNLSGGMNIYWQAADGSTPVERLTTSPYEQNVRSWSPDEKWLAFEESRPDTGWDLWLLPLDPERSPRPYLQTEFDEQLPRISPDGRLLAYQSNESGRSEIYVGTFPEPGRRWQVSTAGGRSPIWNPRGGELLYMNGDDVLAVDIAVGTEVKIGSPHAVFIHEGPTIPDYDRVGVLEFGITPDGERIAKIEPDEPLAPIESLELVLNWSEDLRRLVPTP